MKYFVEGTGKNNKYQLDAFLAYWLNYFVFPSPLEDDMYVFAFPMAVLLAQGKKLALAPWYLGSLYARLDECSKNITQSVERYDVVSYMDANFL